MHEPTSLLFVSAKRPNRPAFRSAVIFFIWVLATPVAHSQLIGTTTIEVDNPIRAYGAVSVAADNAAGNPSDPSCAAPPLPLECANSRAAIATPMLRKWTTAVPTRRADLVISQTNDVDVLVPGSSVIYTITVENPSATTGRVFTESGGTIIELDLSDGTVSNYFPSPVAATAKSSFGLATTGTGLLAGGSRLDPIVELDPDSGATVRTIDNPGIEIAALAFRDGEIFALDEDCRRCAHRVFVLDAATGEVRRVLTAYGDMEPPLGGGLAASNDRIYVSARFDGRAIWDLDPIDRRVRPFALFGDFNLIQPSGIAALDDELAVSSAGDEEGIRVYDLDGNLSRVVLPAPLRALGADHYEQRSAVTTATVTDIFPPELSCVWSCDGTGGATCSDGITFGDINDTANLPVGGLVTYSAACQISASALGAIENVASVSTGASVFELDLSSNSASDIDSLVATSDLAVGQSDDRDPIGAGASLTYLVKVDNPGPSDAVSATVRVTLPTEVTLVATSGCDNDPSGAPSCQLGTLEAGDSASFEVEVLVDEDVMSPELQHQVSVTSASTDLNATNNVAVEATQVDATPPTVTSIAEIGEALIEECEEVRNGVTHLLVTFSKPVFDPIGDSDPADVTHPGNYQLIGAGPDGDFDTTSCGTVAGDDVAVTVDAVIYEAGPQRATLAFNIETALEDSLYRLLVCSSPGIEDLAGNRLDGDGSGSGGGDFVRTYRIERENLFGNGHFDCRLGAWTAVSTDPAEIAYDEDDVQASAVSGSAALTNLSASLDFLIGQCPDVSAGSIYALSGFVRVEVADSEELTLSRGCEFYSQAGCAGAPIGFNQISTRLEDSAGAWIPFSREFPSPAGAQSALCSFDLSVAGGGDFNVSYDQLRFSNRDELLTDGFESGDTSAWSGVFP